jgi:hypothetical protein
MLQRIYREIMMMGLMSFALSLALLAGVPFPHGLMIAFEFGDLTLFMTSIYFCLQGLWVMFVSIGLGNAWDRASKITTEELQIDVENCHASSRSWKRLFYPFSVTRNQVEFRIFQSIFSSSYSISTKHTELDFGLFLKITHENNLLHIIDFDITKWALILLLIGLAAVKVQFFHSSCSNPECEATEEIWVFTCCGVVVLLLSILLFYWGRKSEILLIQKSGVESVEDYPVFLMVESQMQAQFEKNALKTANVKTAINELMVEAESSKLEAESKKRKTNLFRTAQLVASLAAANKAAKDHALAKLHSLGENGVDHPHAFDPHQGSLGPSHSLHSGGPLESKEQDGHPSESLVKPYSPPSPRSRLLSTKLPSSGLLDLPSRLSDQSSKFGDLETPHDHLGDGSDLVSAPPPTPGAISSFISRLSLSHRSPAAVIPEVDVEAAHPLSVMTESPLHQNQQEPFHFPDTLPPHPALPPQSDNPPPPQKASGTSSPWKKAKQLLRQLSSTEDTHERKKIKSKIKTNYQQQRFPDVFLLQSPEAYYTLLHSIITCNSLYLALWTTNFAIIANRGHHPAHSALLIVLSLLPALFALPFISQAIKSSSILKAVTKLNLDVVSSVVEKTETRIKVLEDLRRKLTHHLEKETQDMVIGKAEINSLYEQYNLENPCGLSREEFIELLEGSRIHYTRHKCRTIFTALDLNRDGFISMEVPSLLSYSLSPPPPSSLCRSSSGSSSRRRLSRTISRKGNSSMRRTASCSEEWASTPQRRGS